MIYTLIIYTLAVSGTGSDLKITHDRVIAGTYENLAQCYIEARRLKLPVETFTCVRKIDK